LEIKKKIVEIRKKKNTYRDQMLIEKSIGMYDAGELKKQMDTTTCHYCGDIIKKKPEEGEM